MSSLKDFQIITKLGHGAFSSVYKVKRITDGQEYALKKVNLGRMTSKEKENALNEVRLLASIDHENIVSYKEAFLEDLSNTLCIVMEYADGGDLYHYILQHSQSRKYLSEKRIWQLFTQILKGLKVLHDQSILHRDIKSSNIFLTKSGRAKLGDLNVSKILKYGMLHTQTGTPYYASPEVWSDKPYDHKSDMWSLGCVLYEMCTLKPPFRADDMRMLHQKVCKGMYQPIPKHFSTELSETVKGLLQLNPTFRPNLGKLIGIFDGKVEVEKMEEKKIGKPPLKHGALLDTIRMPRNIRVLKDRLPKPNYEISQRGRSVERKKASLSMVDETSRGPEKSVGRQMPREFEKHLVKSGKAGVPPCSKFAVGKENIEPAKK